MKPEPFPTHEYYLLHLARRAGAWRLSPEDRDDLLQEMRLKFAHAWDTADHTQPPARVRGYCGTAAKNAASNWHRARNTQGRIPASLTDSLNEPLPTGEGTRLDILPAPATAPTADHATITHALTALPPKQRTVITRYYFHGETMQEIADHLRVTRMTISNLHRQALATLLRILRDPSAT